MGPLKAFRLAGLWNSAEQDLDEITGGVIQRRLNYRCTPPPPSPKSPRSCSGNLKGFRPDLKYSRISPCGASLAAHTGQLLPGYHELHWNKVALTSGPNSRATAPGFVAQS